MTLIGSIDPYALKIPARRAERSFTRFHPEVATRRHSALAAWPRLVRQNGPIGDRLQHVVSIPALEGWVGVSSKTPCIHASLHYKVNISAGPV